MYLNGFNCDGFWFLFFVDWIIDIIVWCIKMINYIGCNEGSLIN